MKAAIFGILFFNLIFTIAHARGRGGGMRGGHGGQNGGGHQCQKGGGMQGGQQGMRGGQQGMHGGQQGMHGGQQGMHQGPPPPPRGMNHQGGAQEQYEAHGGNFNQRNQYQY